MAMLKSFDLQGIQDFVDDYLDQVVPEDNPFTKNLQKVSTNTPIFRWVQDKNDALTAPMPAAIQEGEQMGNFPMTLSDQSERENNTQIFSREIMISDSAAATKVHGRTNKSELQYQIEKAITALHNDIEKAFLSGQLRRKASNGVAPLTDAASSQLPAEMVISGPITADNINTLAQALFQNGSTADTILCSSDVVPLLKKFMLDTTPAEMVKVGRPLQLLKSETCKISGDKCLVEKNSFTDANGRLYCVCASRHLNGSVLFMFNHDDFAQVIFRDIKVSELAKGGSYVRYLVECEVGLRHQGRHKAGMIAKP